MSHLLPHEWDRYGQPPKPGIDYPDPLTGWACDQEGHEGCHDADECIDRLEMEAQDHYEEEERLQDEARAERDKGDDLYRKADAIRVARGEKPKWAL